MRTIVLTGISRGLGKALHNLLVSSNYAADKKIFISRELPKVHVDLQPLEEHLCMDFSERDINFNNITLSKGSHEVIFINNASIITPIAKTLNMPLVNTEAAMNVNYWAPLKLAQHLASESQRIGVKLYIINISSGAANRAIQGWLAYCVSKSSIKMAFDVLAEENKHVDVIHFDPGVMDTDMQTTIRSVSKEEMHDIALFKSFKDENKLKPPSQVACEIVNIIERFQK